MSHDLRWRGSCNIRHWILLLHFEETFHSTRRDSHGRWLWRLDERSRGAAHGLGSEVARVMHRAIGTLGGGGIRGKAGEVCH